VMIVMIDEAGSIGFKIAGRNVFARIAGSLGLVPSVLPLLSGLLVACPRRICLGFWDIPPGGHASA